MACKKDDARPADDGAALDRETARAAAAADADQYQRWLRTQGLAGSYSGADPHAMMLALYRRAEDRRARAKHAPSALDRERAERNADRFEQEADAIRATLPEFTPHIAGGHIPQAPTCEACGEAFGDTSSRWAHRLYDDCNPN